MLDGYKNVREWRIWTQGGARREKHCRFGGGMLRMWNVECWIWNGACGTGIFLPRISDRHRCHSDCLSITQITPPARQIDADLFAGGEGFIMWSVENVECGVLNESRWMLNGFIMGSMGRRGCVFTVQKVITVSKNARQWDVWNARNLIFVAKKAHRSPRGTMTGKAAEESQVVQ